MKILASQTRQIEADLATLNAAADTLEKEYKVKRDTLKMLPNASEHIKQLQQICAQSARNLMELGQEWETHRKPMIEQLRQHKDQQTTRKEKCKAMIEEMKRCRVRRLRPSP